jgi:undecaprenyl-diphosphatase
MTDRKAFLMIGAGLLLMLAGAACWWLGADLTLHHMLRAAGPTAARIVFLSGLGGFATMGPVAVGALAILLWRRRMIDAVWLLLTIAIGRLAVEGMKLVVMRPRPPQGDWLEIVKSWSFPSSHSAGTMMTCVALALLFGRGNRSMIAALLAALAIGWSRVALGVHWPSDVLAGWGFGLAFVGLSLGLRGVVAPSPEPRR